MIFLKKIKWWIYNWVGFVLVLCITSVAYWAYVSITNVNPGETLSASLFNEVLENQRVLKSSVVPAWFVWTFNLSTCPTGRIPANGTNGTPDLRWEFVRWLDSWRGVDTGRGLWTLQRWSLVMNTRLNTDVRLFGLSHEGDDRLWYDSPLTDSTKIYYWSTLTPSAYNTWWVSWNVDSNFVKMTRPRNVALLYCVKQ